MVFRQLYDQESSTYTYIMASGPGREALIIDPVASHTDAYIQLLKELDIKLVRAFDTHVHADHVTALGNLREATSCITTMGEQTKAECVSETVTDGQVIDVDGIKLHAIYTPGHTDDSYTYRVDDNLFTGDTLLIRGTGRTDFQNGDSYQQYDSLFNKLLKFDDATWVYPGHDYKGWTRSTIGEEKAFNPRLQVKSADEYAELMAGLGLANPKLMDVAVPANLKCGVLS